MILKHLQLQNFRSYIKSSFDFSPETTIIVGPNTAGKTNIVEALSLVSLGKSFKGATDVQLLRFESPHGRVIGQTDEHKLEIVLPGLRQGYGGQGRMRFLMQGVAKRRVDFVGKLPAVFFSPLDLDIVHGSPSHRREFLDSILEQTDSAYRRSLTEYMKALRQRNALLELVQETGRRDRERFEYWDNLLIQHGSYITKERQSLIDFINSSKQDIFACELYYDHSSMSRERLDQYAQAEVGAGVTLVGPHRDDVTISLNDRKNSKQSVKMFGSRGQQRLVVLQLKSLQLAYMEEKLGVKPLFVLDDIFSELDEDHIDLVLQQVTQQQTIITTTHEEFIKTGIAASDVIKLGS